MTRSNLARIVPTLAIALVLYGIPSADATDIDDCVQKSGQDAIAACTAVIGRGDKESSKDRARAFYNRGVEYANKHNYDMALLDYTEAIKIDPRYEPAIAARGLAFEAQGDLNRAQGAFKAAIALRNDDKLATEGLQRVNKRISALPDIYTDKLISAAGRGDIAAVKAFIGKGANVNAVAANGATALIVASQQGHLDLVKVLIVSGADLNTAMRTVSDENMSGATALMVASWAGHLDVVLTLIARGATVDARADDGKTALLMASFSGYPDVVRALIDKGADVNAEATALRATALMLAAMNGHLSIVKILIAKGADAFAEDSDGMTAIVYAVKHEDVRAFLDSLITGQKIEVEGWIDRGSIGMHEIGVSGALQPAVHRNYQIVRCQDGHDYLLRFVKAVPDDFKIITGELHHYKLSGQIGPIPAKFLEIIREVGPSFGYVGPGANNRDISGLIYVRNISPIQD